MIKSVDIFGITYDICEVDCISKTESLLGQIDFVGQRILIDKTISDERKAEVLLHEIMHGIAEATGLDEKLDEQVIQILSRSLYSLLKSQPLISFSLKAFGLGQTPQQS